ncbi:hypothetical protein [Thiolapillus sp.]
MTAQLLSAAWLGALFTQQITLMPDLAYPIRRFCALIRRISIHLHVR